MKALRYLGDQKLAVEDMPTPRPGAGEVLLRVRACGICGSDVHGWLGKTGRRIPPMTMGHEFSAEVVENGPGAGKFQPGDGVIVQPICFCGHCKNCQTGLTNYCLNKIFFGVLTKDGAMAEYLCAPEQQLYPLPSGCSYEVGALAEPYAVAYGAVKKAGNLAGKRVMIIGAGAIGLCILQLAALQRPAQLLVCDLSDSRLATARSLGATATVNPGNTDYLQAVSDLTGGEMIDISLEAVGVQATANQSIRVLTIGGRAVWVGMSQREMEINMQDIVCSAREILGSFNYTHREFGEVVSLLGSGKMAASQLISRVCSLEEAPQAFEDLYHKPDELIKIILKP
ncbi:MAG: alcohol dehydrogenase catalytic domain-containing protein [Oscillospiraceae bacterium]|nr:alcohol dehydrogenase catalytic domain-containing protein [Oscillospiraceae bacterium]